ncbi:MAG: TetR/AcrR family transcriptional regulator [Nocardioidaceae bacterium]|nr:TetR/AcrR family transcriptional regulator [Nocardioidaceae bacterium]
MTMRADARRNAERLLAAARELISERGPNVPLDEVAKLAGVGIGTLYRRFPDRDALLRAVVLDALAQTRDAAERAAETEDPFEALATYLRLALELRVSAVMPQVLDLVIHGDAEMDAAREASAKAVEALVDAARESGDLPEDVTFADVGMMLVRIARPLPGPMPTELKDELARRHLELFLRGLRTPGGPLTGPSLSREDLGRL